MPRRRMIDPSFWDDHYVALLSRDQRLFLLGCVSNADDEGRLKGHPAYLKAAIFMYDDDLTTTEVNQIKQDCLGEMASWPQNHPLRLAPYENSKEEYLAFPSWYDTQKPSHPTPSKLPALPLDNLSLTSSISPDILQSQSGEPPPQYSIGKVSIGKVSVGDISGIDPDLVLLSATLEKLAGRLPSGYDGQIMEELKSDYPVTEIVSAMNKAVEVTGHWPGWKYVETMCKRGKGAKPRGRPGKLPTTEELRKSWGRAAEVSDAIAEEHLREYEKEHPEEFRDSMST